MRSLAWGARVEKWRAIHVREPSIQHCPFLPDNSTVVCRHVFRIFLEKNGCGLARDQFWGSCLTKDLFFQNPKKGCNLHDFSLKIMLWKYKTADTYIRRFRENGD